ncbi:MAG: DUF1275 domain-containing protein [Candidatus Rokuibacteriota bacterium]|nr:MAG: DUF1275 domain-containing protein [Candidatus Rokubacteria bacterium]
MTDDDDGLLGLPVIPVLLSAIAGSLDVIGLLELGLFTAHLTGNLALLAAQAVRRGDAPVAPLLAVPVFVAALAVTRMLVSGLRSLGLGMLRPLLLVELLLLAGCLAVRVTARPSPDPNAASTVLAGMLGVTAMGVQNVLVSLRGEPPTTVMTSNVTRLALDVGEILLGPETTGEDRARRRARQTWPVVAGFVVGCGLGAACLVVIGPWSLALPAGLTLLALASNWRKRLLRATVYA